LSASCAARKRRTRRQKGENKFHELLISWWKEKRCGKSFKQQEESRSERASEAREREENFFIAKHIDFRISASTVLTSATVKQEEE
jgi:hypothetical protein